MYFFVETLAVIFDIKSFEMTRLFTTSLNRSRSTLCLLAFMHMSSEPLTPLQGSSAICITVCTPHIYSYQQRGGRGPYSPHSWEVNLILCKLNKQAWILHTTSTHLHTKSTCYSPPMLAFVVSLAWNRIIKTKNCCDCPSLWPGALVLFCSSKSSSYHFFVNHLHYSKLTFLTSC